MSGGELMGRKIYISDGTVSLVEYLAEDDAASYENWQDPETKSGFNYVLEETFEEYSGRDIKQSFYASIMLNEAETIIGAIGLSPKDTPPDLAIWMYRPFRGQGNGPKAFSLGVSYCFKVLGLEKIYAGCYPHNQASMRMLKKCGFIPHPSGDMHEKHYLTGEPLIQYDFVLYNPVNKTELTARIVAGLAESRPPVEICAEAGVDKKEFYKKIYTLIDEGQIPNVLSCYCGHDCARCRTFHATLKDDDEMRERIAEFYKAEFHQDIPLKELHCLSGRSDEIMEGCLSCPFMKCSGDRGIDACKKCSDYPCPTLRDYTEAYVNKVNQI